VLKWLMKAMSGYPLLVRHSMTMLSPVLRQSLDKRYQFLCEGCGGWHDIPIHGVTDPKHFNKTKKNPKPFAWHFSGTLDKPTIRPSLLTSYYDDEKKKEVTCCHLFVTNGEIQFLGDCGHHLAGKTVPMQVWPADQIKRANDSDAWVFEARSGAPKC